MGEDSTPIAGFASSEELVRCTVDISWQEVFMIRIVALSLAAGLVVACSQPAPSQSAAGTAAPAATTPPAQAEPQPAQPATPPASAEQPATTAGQAAPSAAAAQPAATAAPPPPSEPAQTPPSRPVTVGTAPPPPPPAPEPPPAPKFREVTVPAGTEISVKILNTLASN